MSNSIEDLPFAVEIDILLQKVSFGRKSVIGFSQSEFSDIDQLDEPFFSGVCYFGRNNLDIFPEEYGVFLQRNNEGVEKISNEIGVTIGLSKRDYSFAYLYAKNGDIADLTIALKSDIFHKIKMCRQILNLHICTSYNEHKRIIKDLIPNVNDAPNEIIADGDPDEFLSFTRKFIFHIKNRGHGRWFFRVRLVAFDFRDFDEFKKS